MNLLDGLITPQIDLFGFNIVFKLLFFIIIVGYIFYAFLLLLRVRILSDTVSTKNNKFVQLLVFAHLIVALLGGFLAMIVILLA